MGAQAIETRFAIIGGSQGFKVLHKLGPSAPIGTLNTPFGESQPVHVAEIDDLEVLVVSRHGETGYSISAPFVNYRANIWALKELGVERIIAWSGPGAIDPTLRIGEIVVPGDLIDETRGRASTFFEGLGLGFIRQNPVFCPELTRGLARSIASHFGDCRTDDVYVCTQGPRLETAAEIRKFASFGASLVGMTLAPEAFLAHELEMCYCPVCYVTNYAEGVLKRDYMPGELFDGMATEEEKRAADSAVEAIPHIAAEAFLLAKSPPECSCHLAMERYRRRGDIPEDWRLWIRRSGE